MNALQEVVDYLENKISTVNVNNPKANAGAKHLALAEIDIYRATSLAFDVIQQCFTKVSSDSPAGECKLTHVSTMLGINITKQDKDNGLFEEWKKNVTVGDLFIEAFYNLGFIDLYYPQRRDSFHVVLATNKWTDLRDIDKTVLKHTLRSTQFTKPERISGSVQAHNLEEKPIIKGNRIRERNQDIGELDKPWLRAIDKLQRTGWQINRPVFEAMKAARDNFISFEPIKDNKEKEVRRCSKVVEFSYTVARAEQLVDEDVFYQLIEADYRGRIYYSEPFLTFQSSDFSRGIMQFARGKPMDKHGLFWLAAHTACSYNQSYNIDEIPDWCDADYYSYLKDEGLESISVDKMTLEDRVRWTNENMNWIRQAGIDHTIYYEAEKSISFLACCIEWHEYNVAVDTNKVYLTASVTLLHVVTSV